MKETYRGPCRVAKDGKEDFLLFRGEPKGGKAGMLDTVFHTIPS